MNDFCLETNETFCLYPWLSVFNNVNGDIRPCCLHKGPSLGKLENTTFREAFNSELMKQLRLDMLSGKQNSVCELCYNDEMNAGHSLRLFRNRVWSHKMDVINLTEDDGTVPFEVLWSGDFRFSNECHYKCVMCNPELSSAWVRDEERMYDLERTDSIVYKPKSKVPIIEQVEEFLPNLGAMWFAGGEPLVTDEVYYLLNRFIEMGMNDIELNFDTSIIKLEHKGEHIIDLWKNFNNLMVSVSIDAVGKRGEYIRYGLNYKKWKEKVSLLRKELPKARIQAHCTVSIFNIFHLPEFCDEMMKLGFDDKDIVFTPLTYPVYQRYSLLPLELKCQCDNTLMDYIDTLDDTHEFIKMQLSYIRNDMIHENVSDNYRMLLVDYIEKLDKIRRVSCLDVCPELRLIFEHFDQLITVKERKYM